MIELRNVTKKFGDLVAVNDLSLTVEKGELVTLLGESGCGKTTTIRCIAGLEEIDSGEIYIDGDLHSSGEEGVIVPPREKEIGMVFQNYAIWPHKSVFKNVSYGLEVRGVDKETQKQRVSETLERVGLGGLEDRQPTELSGGQQQRVVLARSLVYEPDALLLDEPLANLDAALREQLQKEIKRLQRSLDITFLYVTHNQDEAMVLSDRIAILNDGELIEYDNPRTIYRSPSNLYSAEFIGKMNLIEIESSKTNGAKTKYRTSIGEIEVTNTKKENRGQKLMIRPHHFRRSDGTATANVFDMNVDELFYSGSIMEVSGSINGEQVVAQLLESEVDAINPGDTIQVTVDPDGPVPL